MTEKVYEKHSYFTELNTVVTDCVKEDGKIYLSLKETIFFPEEGGQYSDTGVIVCGDKEIHVLKGELIGSATEGDTDIRYLVDDELPAGSIVKCILDWNVRFDRMQNHSGEHIVSGLIHNFYGYNNIGFHLSDDEPVTLTVDGKLDDEQIAFLESKANEAIYADLPITDSYPTKEKEASIVYRSKIDIAGQVRLIFIGDPKDPLDVCACCAPHVSHTGAIGIIKILSSASVKGGTQLSILCGRRAFEYIDHSLKMLDGIANSFSTHPDNVPGLVQGLKDKVCALNAKLAEVTEKEILEEVDSGDFTGTVFTDMDLTPLSMKNIYNAMIEKHEGYVGIFAGDDENGYRYYAGGKGLDARELGNLMREKLGAKGGGSPEMIQGRITVSSEEVRGFWSGL